MLLVKKQLLKRFNWQVIGFLIAGFLIDRAIKIAVIYFWPIAIYKNFGLIFSVNADYWIILTISIIFCGVLLFVLIHTATNKNKKQIIVPIALILAGAFGNLYDRLAFGYVIDYIYVPTIISSSAGYFNFADILILAGVAWIIKSNLTKSGRA